MDVLPKNLQQLSDAIWTKIHMLFPESIQQRINAFLRGKMGVQSDTVYLIKWPVSVFSTRKNKNISKIKDVILFSDL